MIDENIHIYNDVEALNEGFTSFLKEQLSMKEKVNLSLSGGSTPKVLFNYWAKFYLYDMDWNRIFFFWGDERCVVPDDPMSNFGMTKELLFDKIEAIPDRNIHRIHGENEPNDEAKRYSSILNKFLPKENEIPAFDIFMLGLGDDGHTVSIFPNQIELWDKQENCVVTEHPETKMPRVSLTGKVVNNAYNIVFLVTGKNKAEKIKQIIQQKENFTNTYPAARVNPQHGNLYWFLDEEAAGLL